MRTLFGRFLVIAAGCGAALAPTSGVAADFTVSLVAPRNHSVMREAEATIVVRVTNLATAPAAIPGVNFKFGGACGASSDDNQFSESMTAPPGWSVENPIGADLVKLVAGAGAEILPGAFLDFHVLIKGDGRVPILAATADRNDTLAIVEAEYTAGKQSLSCATPGALPRWKRHAFALVSVVSPLSAGVGGQVSLDTQLENRATQNKTGITVATGFPRSSPTGATFSAPSPALPIALASGAAATIKRTVSSLPTPSFVVQEQMRDGTGASTSPLVVSETVYVGPLTANLSVSPSVTASGTTVEVEMVVTNHTAYALGDVRPDGNPVQTGTATATLASGPTPASVSSLAPNSSATFRWSYTVTGLPLTTYVFQGSAVSNGYQSPLATSNAGEITAFSATAIPGSIASGDAGPIDFQVDNGTSTINVNKTITFIYPAGWAVSTAPAPGGWTSAILNAGRTVEYTATTDSLAPGERLVFRHSYGTVPAPSSTADAEHAINVELKPSTGAAYYAVATLISTATRLALATSPSPAVQPADGRSLVTLTATLTRVSDGSAIAGERVNFETTAGALSATSAITDANGQATVTVEAPASSVDLTGTASASRFDAVDTAPLTFTGVVGANLLYVGGSLFPRQVAPGTIVTFSFWVKNVGTTGVTIPTVLGDTTFSFSDGTVGSSSLFTGPLTIAAGETITVTFGSTVIPSTMAFGSYFPVFSYNPSETLPDPVVVTSTPTWASVVGLAADPYGDGVRLSWATDLELMNQGFRVLRGTNGAEPETLDAWVPSAGTDFASYEWIDAPVGDGVHEYWIEDVDDAGRATRHGPVALALGVDGGAAPPAGESSSSSEWTRAEDPSVWLDPDELGDVRVLAQDETGITWEIVPPPHSVAEVPGPFGVRHLVRIDGWDATDEPGLPILPTRTLRVPLPPHTTGRLTLLEADEETLSGLEPALANGVAIESADAQPIVIAPFPRTLPRGALWPADNATLVDRGRMGTQRVVSVVVSPMRANPSAKSVRRTNRLVVRVDYVPTVQETKAVRTAAELVQRNILRGASLDVHATRDGLVRVPLADLAAAGIDPGNAAVYHAGVAVPARVVGDALFFVVPPFESHWSRGKTWWIAGATAGGASPLLVLDTVAAGVGATASTVRHELAFERDLFFGSLSAQGAGPDRWYWTQVATGGAQSASVDLASPATGTAATIAVTLQGLFDDESADDEHAVRVLLGGMDLGTVRFAGYGRVTADLAIPDGTLGAGSLLLAIENVSTRTTRVALDRAVLSFDAPADAAGGLELAVRATTTGILTAGGFSAPVVWAVDETDPLAPRMLAVAVEGNRAAVSATAGNRVRFVAANALAPATWTARAPGSALDAAGGADFVVVAGSGLLDSARAWAEWRAAHGLRAIAVDAAAIDDELGFGDPDPAALRRFFELASATWAAPAPRYALLLGDSTFDPRDNLGAGLPGGMLLSDRVGTRLLDAPSDTATAAFGAGDRLPDLAIGRVPVRTPAEAATALGKVIAYETAPRDGWNAREVFLADDDLPEFAATMEDAARFLPLGVTKDAIDASIAGDAAARATLLQSIHDGAALASYFGHGAVQSWGGELYLGVGDGASLANARLPVVAAVDCLNAYFDHPTAESLGETLVRAPAGAIAVWTSSAITRDGGHRELSRAFHRAFWREPDERLGDVVNRAYAQVAGRDDADELIGTFLLLGDPALRLNVNRAPTAIGRLLQVNGLSATVSGAASYDVDGDALAYRWDLVSAPEGATASIATVGADATLMGSLPGLYRLRLRVADASVAGPGDDVAIELRSAPAKRGDGGGFGCSVATTTSRQTGFAVLGLIAAVMFARRRR